MEESQFYRWLHQLGLLALSYLVLRQVWTLLIGIKNHILSRWWRTNLKNKYGGWAGLNPYPEYELSAAICQRSSPGRRRRPGQKKKSPPQAKLQQQERRYRGLQRTNGAAPRDTMVTGATDGIGKAYAMELARRGFDVVLISRNVEKLQKVAQEIEKQSRQKTKIIQLDFTGGSEIYPKVEKVLKDLDIGILVNNVGMLYQPGPSRFLDVSDINKRISDILNCNVLSIAHMTRIVLPRMVVRKKGLIINISSAAGAHPYPMTAIYGATKAFVDFFSRSLHYEYRSDGITVQSVIPNLVSTNMTYNISTNILVKTSDDFAREALNTVGYTHRTNGCLSHCFQGYIIDHLLTETFMNSSICRFIAGCAMKMIFKLQKVN